MTFITAIFNLYSLQSIGLHRYIYISGRTNEGYLFRASHYEMEFYYFINVFTILIEVINKRYKITITVNKLLEENK